MKEKYFEMRLAGALWGTGERAKNYKSAVKKFLNNPIYSFKPGEHTVEINRSFYVKAFIKEIKTTKIEFKNKEPIKEV